jgi:Flp pilus assembly protein CpaB
VIVASGARVLEVDDGDATDDANAGVTLLVTEPEARVLAFAAANGDLSLAIAPPEAALHSPP